MPGNGDLTHVPLDKMPAISQTTLSETLFKWKLLYFDSNYSILMFVPKGPIDNKWALVEVIAWCRTGDKSLPEPLLTLTHICGTRGKWVKVIRSLWHLAGVTAGLLSWRRSNFKTTNHTSTQYRVFETLRDVTTRRLITLRIDAQGPVLILRHDAVARILANGRVAFFESCAAIGWKDCYSVISP